MNKALIALTGFGLGATAMYYADPQEGKRRRARVRDGAVHASRTVSDAAGAVSRDAQHRVTGLAARATAALGPKTMPADAVLEARVRAQLGRLVSHPKAIDVKVASGAVTLEGTVFTAEIEQLVRGVGAVPGVTQVDNRVITHDEAGSVPGLQGAGPLDLHGRVPGWARWTPTTRVAIGALGVSLIAAAARRRTLGRTAVGFAGFELLEQALRAVRRSAA